MRKLAAVLVVLCAATSARAKILPTLSVREATYHADTVVLAGKLQFAPGDVVLEADPAAKPKAVRIRNGILKGTTG